MAWYKTETGKTSTMRIVTMLSTVVGCIAVLAGVVAMFMRIPESVPIAGVGAGMAGIGEISKAWQAKGEK